MTRWVERFGALITIFVFALVLTQVFLFLAFAGLRIFIRRAVGWVGSINPAYALSPLVRLAPNSIIVPIKMRPIPGLATPDRCGACRPCFGTVCESAASG